MSEESEGHGREQTQGTTQVPAGYAGIHDESISSLHMASSRPPHHHNCLTALFHFKADSASADNYSLRMRLEANIHAGRGRTMSDRTCGRVTSARQYSGSKALLFCYPEVIRSNETEC